MSAPLNLLVTGGAGFIGSHFVARAVAQGCRVVVLDALTYAGSRDNLEAIPASPGHWVLVEGSICDGALVARLMADYAISQVVNFAAESHVDNSISGPAAFIDTNIQGTYQLLEASRRHAAGRGDFRFIQVSTDEVYGSLDGAAAFSEASPLKPSSPYSASKAAADHLVGAWGKTYGLPAMITRCSNNYGPRQHPEKLIPAIIMAALAGKPLPVYGDGRNRRDWLHVQDHCEWLWLALTNGKPGAVYNFGGGDVIENIALVHMLCDLLDAKRPKQESYAAQIAFVADRLGHDQAYAMDDGFARAELGFAPKRRLAEGLDATVEWYLAHTQWCNSRRMA